MATPSNGVYLIESDSGNEDWVTTHSGDPELLTVGNFTSGTDMIYFDIVEVLKPSPKAKGEFYDVPGWTSIDITLEEGHGEYDVEVSYQGSTFALTRAKMADLEAFHRNHSAGITDNVTYMFERFTTDSYHPFFNASRAEKKYCKGRIIPGSLSYYIEFTVLYAKWKWRSVW